MSISEKFEVIAEAVYEKGRQDEWSDFWDIFQNKGERKDYNNAFRRWDCEYIRPKYKAVSTNGGRARIFEANLKLKKVEKEYFDFSKASPTNQSTDNYFTFQHCEALEEIEDIGLMGEYAYGNTFINCYKLHTIELVRSNENVVFTDTFKNCHELKNITFEGVIGKNISFSESRLLTVESLNSIIDHLKDFTAAGSGSATITLHTDSKTLIGEEGLKRITNKGWEVM